MLAPARVVLIMWWNKLNTSFLRKEQFPGQALNAYQGSSSNQVCLFFPWQSETCCFLRSSECWASFLASVPSAEIHQQFSLLPAHKHIHQHFFDTEASPTRLSSLRMWSTRLLSSSWSSTSLWHALAFQQVTGHVSWENRDPEYFLYSCTEILVSAWSWPCAMNMTNCKQGWELLESAVVLSFILSEEYFFLSRAGHVKWKLKRCSRTAVKKYYVVKSLMLAENCTFFL